MERLNISSGGPFEDSFGYSRAVRIGKHIHVSGTCARPPHDTGNAYTQATGALQIIGIALSEGGATFEHVIRTVVYITNAEHIDGVSRAHRETFADILPASTALVVAALLQPHLLVEIEAYAILS